MFDDPDFWDDRTIELYYSEGIHPCYGCGDFIDDVCISNGACALESEKDFLTREEKENE